MFTKLSKASFILVFSFLLILFVSPSFAQIPSFNAINTKDVTIVRDSFGVAHIYGKSDADAAFGLAYANCEDAFHIIQDQLYLGRGALAQKKGVEGAKIDFFTHLIAAREFAENHYNDLNLDTKKYLNGYVQGANYYAQTHPKEVSLPKIFPATEIDVLTAYIVSLSFLSGASGPVSQIMDGKYDEQPMPKGSNAYAMNQNMTSDGKVYLCVNPHFMMEGAFTFYEAHINSDEGLNFHGAVFQGGTSLFLGNNENLGWGLTYNYFDRSDVFALKMKSKHSKYYEIDGQYKKLETKKVWLKVALKKNLVIPVKKKTYWSEIGPTLKSKNGEYYSMRFPANMTIKICQQMYYMNKAKNFSEFKKAIGEQALTFFNMVYADKDQNLYYVSYGTVPNRNPKYDYNKVVPGWKSDAIWNSLIPVDSLPHVENPDCGYIFNTNNTPFYATCKGENDNPDRLPKYIDERPGNNNRADRLLELISTHYGKFNYSDFKSMKFDVSYTQNSKFMQSIQPLFSFKPEDYPSYYTLINNLNHWDLVADSASRGCMVFALCMDYLISKQGKGDEAFVSGLELKTEDCLKAFEYAANYYNKYFHGNQDVCLGEVLRIKRDDKNFACPGFADVLSPVYPKLNKSTGELYPNYGDSYTHFVKFNEKGVEEMETLVPFGASFKEGSKHYSDQLPLYVKHQTKPMTLNKEQIFKNAEQIYHP